MGMHLSMHVIALYICMYLVHLTFDSSLELLVLSVLLDLT